MWRAWAKDSVWMTLACDSNLDGYGNCQNDMIRFNIDNGSCNKIFFSGDVLNISAATGRGKRDRALIFFFYATGFCCLEEILEANGVCCKHRCAVQCVEESVDAGNRREICRRSILINWQTFLDMLRDWEIRILQTKTTYHRYTVTHHRCVWD